MEQEARERALISERQLELENAIELAVASHQAQRDRLDAPYILHCLRIMLAVGQIGATDLMPAAVLHDVVEDTDVTLDELPGHGMSARTVELVDILTRRPEEFYGNYIDRVAKDRQASIIKVVDLKDNIGRAWQLPEADMVRVLAKYEPALALLTLTHNL